MTATPRPLLAGFYTSMTYQRDDNKFETNGELKEWKAEAFNRQYQYYFVIPNKIDRVSQTASK